MSAGPGWLGATILSLFAAGLGGILGMAGTRYIADTSTNPGMVESRLDEMKAGQEEISIRLARTIREQDGLGTNLAALSSEVEALSDRDPASDGQVDDQALQELAQRVAALESVDTSGDVSPKTCRVLSPA